MGIVVMKFGGTSVADAERIRAAARRAIATRKQGHQVVMVVSAMGHTTDELIALAKGITDNEAWRAERPGQFECTRGEMIARIQRIVKAGQ